MTNYPNPRHGGLHEVLSRHFLQQLATAVRFLRERGLVHRDLKPQNLLLLPPPAYADPLAAPAVQPMAGLRTLPMLKVADFGFARHLAEASLADTMCGSPLYMAPEILRSKGYGAEADLWSIGTVLYEMVTARPPFRAANHMELIQKIEGTRDHIRFPEGVAVSSELKAFIRGLLKVEPSRRMGFEEFFGHNVVVGEIPGLVEADLQEQVVQKGVRRASVRDEGATGNGLPDGRMAPPKRPAPRPTSSVPQSRRESIITTHMKAQGRPPSSGTPQIHRTRTEPPISPISPLHPPPHGMSRVGGWRSKHSNIMNGLRWRALTGAQ
ncbi:Serine/threonine-protein kinase [Ascosphaera atra]|nr:Serine/threonine-protein kinase [Ascosphaera atra]